MMDSLNGKIHWLFFVYLSSTCILHLFYK